MKDLSNINVLSLGDSYTIGESVQENDRWSVQLARLLRSRSTDVNNPTIIARTGWTTAELNEAIIASGNKQQYDLVSLMIGVNNQYRGQPIDRYRTEFRQLVQVAVHYARNQPSHVVVLSIPDWGASPFAASRDRATIAKQIDEFNAVASQVCAEAGVTFIDITPLTRQAAGDASQFAADGLHYSGKQMKKWAEKALPIVEKILN
ncbi:SGNH/GDSL hydrolase family protein [Fibrella forsythiae]|nr:SGNH/GDSL hydrolase family protein [Fibrella forsythiae]